MAQFQIQFHLQSNILTFHINIAFSTTYHFECKIQRSDWNYEYFSLQQLCSLLQNKKSNLHFSIQDLQLQIIIPVGTATRAIYLPIQQQDKQKLMHLYQETICLLTKLGNQVQLKRQEGQYKVSTEMQLIRNQSISDRRQFLQSQNRTQKLSQQISVLSEQVMKFNRQILTIDEEIIACKIGLQLEQYREQTSFENREERRRKVYLNQLKKYNHSQIEAILTKELKQIKQVEIVECQLKNMKFVQIFQFVQQLRLPKSCLRKIQGLHSLVYLEILDLSQNTIEKIQGLNNNARLRQLYLQHNKINKLQNIFHLYYLQILALSGNYIEEIPKDIKMLECLIEIRLISNNINVVPSELANLTKLKTFSILGNPCFKESHKSKDVINKLVDAHVATCSSTF